MGVLLRFGTLAAAAAHMLILWVVGFDVSNKMSNGTGDCVCFSIHFITKCNPTKYFLLILTAGEA